MRCDQPSSGAVYLGMRSKLLLALLAAALPLAAQQHEIGLTLGELIQQDRSALTVGSGVALQANYGYRLLDAKIAALYGEVHLLASPQRGISANISSVTRDIATLYVTPGLRLKFLPNAPVSPYVAAGGGYAQYEQSTALINGQANPASRETFHGALDYGGGVDFRGWRWLGFRAEIRDFYTGNPSFNTRLITGGQHNVIVGGGLVIRIR